MTGRTFIDTNVLVYAFDRRDRAKFALARSLLVMLIVSESALISTQVLQELYNALTKKLSLPPRSAQTIVRECSAFEVVQVTPEIIDAAIETAISSKIGLWDALIVAAAARSGCPTLLTEDLNHGQEIDGVRVVNPFLSSSSTV